ncbi:MAG: DUF294 nucleotidyltransferase-like domain-containing protein [Deltaproteobacteria bacterium]
MPLQVSRRVHATTVDPSPHLQLRPFLRAPLVPPLLSKAAEAPSGSPAGLGAMATLDVRTGQDLRTAARVAHLRAMRVAAQRALAGGAPVEEVQEGVSRAIEEVFVDIVEADLERHPAPGRFAVAVLGSVAARESATHSDVDAALVLEDAAHYPWFEAAVDRWRMALTALGEPSGVTFCDQASPVGRFRDAVFGDVDQIASTWSDPERGASYRRGVREGRFVLGDAKLVSRLGRRIAAARTPEVRQDRAERDVAEATENLSRFARATPFEQTVPLRAVRKAIVTLLRGLADRAGIVATNAFERADALRDAKVLDATQHTAIRELLEEVGRFRLLTQLKANCSMDEAMTLDLIDDVLPKSLDPRPDLGAVAERWVALFRGLAELR